MKNLEWPLRDIPAGCIYRQCAYAFTRETSIRDNALKFRFWADGLSAIYPDTVPSDISKIGMPALTELEEGDIEKLYDNKFSKEGETVREYYDAIFANGGKMCPICGVGKRKNLDHFLPKSKYPLLCVTPLNLVPTCRDCNMDKNSKMSDDYYEIPFNPYFDTVSFTWLKCDVEFTPSGDFIPTFRNGFDKATDPNMFNKCEKHISINMLSDTFQNAAMCEIEDEKYTYLDLLNEGGEDEVLKHLRSLMNSCEKNDINSWRTALYRELVSCYHEFCEWIKQLM